MLPRPPVLFIPALSVDDACSHVAYYNYQIREKIHSKVLPVSRCSIIRKPEGDDEDAPLLNVGVTEREKGPFVELGDDALGQS
jgi:hypothetical protein